METEPKKYQCAYCGKIYNSPIERANCEIACEIAEREKAEAKKREHRLKEISALLSILGNKSSNLTHDIYDFTRRYRNDKDAMQQLYNKVEKIIGDLEKSKNDIATYLPRECQNLNELFKGVDKNFGIDRYFIKDNEELVKKINKDLNKDYGTISYSDRTQEPVQQNQHKKTVVDTMNLIDELFKLA